MYILPCNSLLRYASATCAQEHIQGHDNAEDDVLLHFKRLLTCTKSTKLIQLARTLCRQSTSSCDNMMVQGLPSQLRPALWIIIPASISTMGTLSTVISYVTIEGSSLVYSQYTQIGHDLLGHDDDVDKDNEVLARFESNRTTYGLSLSSLDNNRLSMEQHAQHLIKLFFSDIHSSSSNTNTNSTNAKRFVTDISTKISSPIHRILSSLSYKLDILFSPLLPDITAILLTQMSEAHVYATLHFLLSLNFNKRGRKMACKIPISVEEHIQTCEAFSFLLKKKHLKVYHFYQSKGSLLTPLGLDPIFRHMLVPVLPYKYITNVMDLFIIDGIKALFRLGQALLLRFYSYYQTLVDKVSLMQDPWQEIYTFTHAKLFSWNDLVHSAYSIHTRQSPSMTKDKINKVHISNRRAIAKLMTQVQLDRQSLDIYEKEVDHQRQRISMIELKPIRLLPKDCTKFKSSDHTVSSTLLLNPSSLRYNLSRWIPSKLQTCSLELVYSTRHMPANLKSFYHSVRHMKNTVVVMQTTIDNRFIGMFASQEWTVQPRPYGDGQCFLFRLHPNPACFQWSRLQDEKASLALTVLNEQFMMATSKYIGMGGSIDGGYGLRVDDNFIKAYSTKSITFNNDPLGGESCMNGEFDIACVEVYRFVL